MTVVSGIVGEGSAGLLIRDDGGEIVFGRGLAIVPGSTEVDWADFATEGRRREIRRTASDEGVMVALEAHVSRIPEGARFLRGRSLLRWQQGDVVEFLSEFDRP